MGTLSKRGIEQFGDAPTEPLDSAGTSLADAGSSLPRRGLPRVVGAKLDARGALVDEHGNAIAHEKSPPGRVRIDVSDQSDLSRVIAGNRASSPDAEPERRSGLAHQVERVMASVPTATWLRLAGMSMIGAFALRLFGRRALANVVSGWAPMFLVAGLYNKLTTAGAATALLSARR